MGGMARRTRACAFSTGKYPEAPKRLDHIIQKYLQIPVLQAEIFFYGPWHGTEAVTLALTDTKHSQRSCWMSSRPIGREGGGEVFDAIVLWENACLNATQSIPSYLCAAMGLGHLRCSGDAELAKFLVVENRPLWTALVRQNRRQGEAAWSVLSARAPWYGMT